MTKHAFVTVSNRLPISATKVNGELDYTVSSGGLATAMSSVKEKNSAWVGWCGIADEDLNAKDRQAIRKRFAEENCVPVFLSQTQVEGYYEGYANDTIWPLFHYLQPVAHYSDEYWRLYDEVNESFAKVVTSVAQKNATIWIHDYHLMCLPEIVRKVLPASTIGFFLHIPFPSFETYRLLPERSEILHGLLGADIVGFHIYDYAQHFLSSCERLLAIPSHNGQLEFNGRNIRVGTYPIGIDYAKFEKAVASTEVVHIESDIIPRYKKSKLILSIDRLDYSKGIPERMEGFRQLLEEHPEFRGKVQLLMVAVPSRTEVESYRQLRDTIEQTVSRINGMFGTVDWAPISYQFQNRPFEEVVALYSVSDVMLVTPLRDGMNLVAKEYVASKQRNTGVLVLSEMAGAIDELPEALPVNPNSARSIKEALEQALRMPRREQKKRMKVMQKRLKEYDIHKWSEVFMNDLALIKNDWEGLREKKMSNSQAEDMMLRYSTASKRLIIFDYDGTLKSFVNSPSLIAAFPSRHLRHILKQLAKQENTVVAIITGRPKKALQLWFQGIPLELAAEHGAWRKTNGRWVKMHNNITRVKPAVLEVMRRYTAKTPGAEVEEKDFSLVWHYRNVESELAFDRSTKLKYELAKILHGEEIEVYGGDKILEVKQNSINKGRAVADLVKIHSPDFIFCVGDDFTDEDMYTALEDTDYTFKVGGGETRARYRLDSVDDVVSIAEDMSQLIL
jgi:trehalose 6-phosphate synthase/phosphatase